MYTTCVWECVWEWPKNYEKRQIITKYLYLYIPTYKWIDIVKLKEEKNDQNGFCLITAPKAMQDIWTVTSVTVNIIFDECYMFSEWNWNQTMHETNRWFNAIQSKWQLNWNGSVQLKMVIVEISIWNYRKWSLCEHLYAYIIHTHHNF